MNAREAKELRDALTRIEHGPGSGWRNALDGRQPGGAPTTLEERTRSLEIWLESWITPAIRSVVDRYYRPTAAVRQAAARKRSNETTRLRESLTVGEERQGRGVAPSGVTFGEGEDTAPYWLGYYHSIARQAVARLEELEARLEARS